MNEFNPSSLIKLKTTKMPYGKYKGVTLIDLPEPYVVWFKQQGFPEGKIGQQLAAVYEIKVYGLEVMLRPLLNESAPEPEQLVIRF